MFIRYEKPVPCRLDRINNPTAISLGHCHGSGTFTPVDGIYQ